MRKPANLLTRDPREAGANLPLLSKNPPFAPATLIANEIAEPAFVFLFGNQIAEWETTNLNLSAPRPDAQTR
jgi:hypothetical protein